MNDEQKAGQNHNTIVANTAFLYNAMELFTFTLLEAVSIFTSHSRTVQL
jgi:hypothetical protein